MTKPISRNVLKSSNLLDVSYCSYFGSDNTPRKISGPTQEKSAPYSNAMIVIFRKSDFQPIAFSKPDGNGNYAVNGLNKDVACFICGFDGSGKYNAVIQDKVVPK